jgi:hypothetical protein
MEQTGEGVVKTWTIGTMAQVRRVYEVQAETAEDAEALANDSECVLVLEEEISEEIDYIDLKSQLPVG